MIRERSVKVKLETPFIKLGQLLKVAGMVQTGGETKTFLAGNQVFVNGAPATERGKKIYPGDRVVVGTEEIEIDGEG